MSVQPDYPEVRRQRAAADARRDARPPRDADRLLDSIRRKIESVMAKYGPGYAMLLWETATGYPTGGTGARRSSGHSDPTFVAAVSLVAQPSKDDNDPEAQDEDGNAGRIDTNMTEAELWLRQLRHVDDCLTSLDGNLSAKLKLTPTLAAKAYQESRCSGGEGEWQDSRCKRNAVTRDGLCHPCYLRGWRWKRDRDVKE